MWQHFSKFFQANFCTPFLWNILAIFCQIWSTIERFCRINLLQFSNLFGIFALFLPYSRFRLIINLQHWLQHLLMYKILETKFLKDAYDKCKIYWYFQRYIYCISMLYWLILTLFLALTAIYIKLWHIWSQIPMILHFITYPS